MNEPKVAILTLSAALLLPVPRGAAAQVASSVEAGQYTVSEGAIPASVMRVAPALEYQFPYAKLSAHGSAFISDQSLQLADGGVSGTFTSPTVYGVHAEMIGNASRAMDDRSLGDDQVDVQTRVHVLFHERGGLWLGGGVARPWRVAVISSADVTDAGAWTKVGGATFTATFTNFSFTKAAALSDSVLESLACPMAGASSAIAAPGALHAADDAVSAGPCDRQSRFSDLEGSVHWEFRALELDAQTGYRFGSSYDVADDSRRWSSATATVWLDDRVAVIGGGGRQPAQPLRGLPARTFGMVGLELAYWPMSRDGVPVALPHMVLVKSFELHPGTSQGMQKFVMHVGGVETVEVMGDFSDWTPLMVTRRGRDLWELSLPLAPGMHQIDVRVDGGPWMAPPGLPTMHSDYSGDVGLLVVSPEKTTR